MKYEGRWQHRFKDNPLEKRFAKKWQEQNKYGHTLEYLLTNEINKRDGNVSQRDRQVAATVIQWLGSPVGQSFLSEVLEIEIRSKR